MKLKTLSTDEIIKLWLKDHGYDGLYCIEFNCGCIIDDLFSCGTSDNECQAGYKIKAPEDSEYDFIIVPEK